jgi:hypothetical protein
MGPQSSAVGTAAAADEGRSLHGRKVALGVGEDLHEALESLLTPGHAVGPEGDLLRKWREQVAEAGPGLAAQRDVVAVAPATSKG